MWLFSFLTWLFTPPQSRNPGEGPSAPPVPPGSDSSLESSTEDDWDDGDGWDEESLESCECYLGVASPPLFAALYLCTLFASLFPPPV